jgi:hypothetical protein
LPAVLVVASLFCWLPPIRLWVHAAYLFIDDGAMHVGKRLSLTNIKEEADPKRIQAIGRRTLLAERKDARTR